MNHLINSEAAFHLEQVIKSKLSSISVMPKSYAFLSSTINEMLEAFSEFRKVSVKNYILVYRYYEEDDIVVITHIFHQTQDYGKIFQSN